MHTIIETAAYLSAASDAGMTDDERNAVVDVLAANPTAGDIMPGCGGARKLRVARPGKGKSGGYRVITYFDRRYRFQNINQFRSKIVPDAMRATYLLRSDRMVSPGMIWSLVQLLTRATAP